MSRISAVILCCFVSPARAQVIDIEDVTLPVSGYLQTAPFTSHGAGFNNNYNSTFGSWGGFSASRITDVTTPGFGNQYAAYAPPSGGGAGGSQQFAVAYYDAFTPTVPTITLPAGTRPTSVQLTNTTYAYLSMRDGDPFAKKFGGLSGNDPDYFLLTINGYDSGNNLTGSVDFYLADYRFANNAQDYIVNGWTSVNLSSLGNAATLKFDFMSTDVGPFGINTPTFVALDNLTVTAVPEPGSFLLASVVAAAGWLARRRP